jgi:hypothetical protein
MPCIDKASAKGVLGVITPETNDLSLYEKQTSHNPPRTHLEPPGKPTMSHIGHQSDQKAWAGLGGQAARL